MLFLLSYTDGSSFSLKRAEFHRHFAPPILRLTRGAPDYDSTQETFLSGWAHPNKHLPVIRGIFRVETPPPVHASYDLQRTAYGTRLVPILRAITYNSVMKDMILSFGMTLFTLSLSTMMLSSLVSVIVGHAHWHCHCYRNTVMYMVTYISWTRLINLRSGFGDTFALTCVCWWASAQLLRVQIILSA